jgi:uncharacterized membrane protein YeaQ/YmgE (transglycosylase-associated protein family)
VLAAQQRVGYRLARLIRAEFHNMLSIISCLIIGALAGWLAGQFTRGSGFGLPANLGIGIVGAMLGRAVFWLLGLKAISFIGSLITATVGAVILLFLVAKLNQ